VRTEKEDCEPFCATADLRAGSRVADRNEYSVWSHQQSKSAVFSSDGSRIVSGSDDYTVQIWDAVAGTIQHTLKGHADLVTSVAFSSDGSRIMSGSDNQPVLIWDANKGTVPSEYDPFIIFPPFLAKSILHNGWWTLSMESCHC
jgi:WD40 repeat protein